MLIGILGIIVSLILLMTLAYRGMPVIIAAPIASLVALLFSGAPLLASYTEIFMPALAGFVGSYLPLFMLGAIFGSLMTLTGYAESIARTVAGLLGARSALLATVLTGAVMTYGGISLFVVAFVLYPLARELFRVADIPRRLIPATIALAIFTFTMTALPGTPQVQNIIPGQFFGTGGFAAPGVGLLGAAMILGLGMAWLEYRRRAMDRQGEHFDSEQSREIGLGARAVDPDTGEDRGAADSSTDTGTTTGTGSTTTKTATATMTKKTTTLTPTNRLLPFLPLLVVIVVNFGCTLLVFPALDWSYLSEEKFGGITLSSRSGIWAVIVALLVAILVILALHAREVATLKQGVVDGAKGAMLPVLSVSSEVGYGAVVASVAAFAVVRDAVFDLGGNALVTSVVSTSVTAAITGSSSGGMTIALNAFGEQLRQMAVDQGISLEAMHRLTAMAAGGLDTLPHSGAVITLLLVSGLTHRQSYKDIAVITVVIPVVTVAVLVTLVSAVVSF